MFGKRRKTYTTGITQPMNSDENFKYSHHYALAHWLWSGNGNLQEYLQDYGSKTLPNRYDKLYRWCDKPKNYVFGKPKSSLIAEPQKLIINKTKEHISSLYNTEVTFNHTQITDRDFYRVLWNILVEEYDYDSQTNTIGKLTQELNTTVYLYDGVLSLSKETIEEYIHIDNTTLPFNHGQCFDREHSLQRTQTAYNEDKTDFATITYQYEIEEHTEGSESSTKVIRTETLTIDLSFVNPPSITGEQTQIEYDYIYVDYTVNDKYHWFEYALGSGNLPPLDIKYRGKNILGEFYPRLFVRIDNQDIAQHRNKQWSKQSKEIFKRIGLDISQVTNQLHQSIGEEYGNVRAMFIFQGVSVNKADKDTNLAEYCFRYFQRLFDLSDKVNPTQCVGGMNTVQDSVASQRFAYSAIMVQNHQGKITKVNKYTMKRHENRHEFIWQADEKNYTSVTVVNLHQETWLNGINFTAYGDSDGLVIPLDKALVKHLTNKEKEVLFYKGMHISLVHSKTVKKKWYQTGLFQVIMAVVIVVATVIAPPAGASAGAGYATGTAVAVKASMLSLIKGIAISIAINKGLQLLVKQGIISAKDAIIISAVVSIILAGRGANGKFALTNLKTAPQLLNLMNTVFDAYGKLNVLKIQDVIKQAEELYAVEQTQQERIAQAQRLLDTQVFNPIDELMASSYTPIIDPFETVDMFYYRHYGFNVVGLSHSIIEDFVEINLSNKRIYHKPTQRVEEVLLIT